MIQVDSLAHPTQRRIAKFALMEQGWSYGEGEPFAPDVVARALEVHRAMVANGFYNTDAFPGLSGEIVVTLYDGDDYVEVEVRPDLRLDFLWERQGEELEAVEDLGFGDVKRYLSQLRKESWKLSASLTQYTTTSDSSASIAQPSDPLASRMEVASQSSAWTASTLADEPSASTFIHSTPRPLARRRYTGGFLPKFCPMGIS